MAQKQWHKHIFDIVVEGNMCKCQANAELRDRLLATGERELVEASPKDRQREVGFAAEHVEENKAE